tara:strand:- start:302 stop:790 length:489 start_codon:yes stop_codon:yes gene_type:complete
MKYKIIDNALSQEEFKKIKDLVLGFYFPWFFAPYVAQKTSKDGFHFNHVFFGVEPHKVNSDFFNILQPVLNLLKPKAIIRIKANLYPPTENIESHDAHIDYSFPHKGAIFSVNTCDGYTVLKNSIKIDSKENRLLLFDPSIPHNSTTSTNEHGRININFNYF